MRIADRQPDVAISVTSQVADAVSQTVEDGTVTPCMSHFTIGELTYQFLLQVVDLKSDNLMNKLADIGIILSCERQMISAQESATEKLRSLLIILREKSASEFERFLTTLTVTETDQQPVAAAVLQAIHTLAEQGQNPLQYAYGEAYALTLVSSVCCQYNDFWETNRAIGPSFSIPNISFMRSISEPELDMDWIHPWIGLDWVR